MSVIALAVLALSSASVAEPTAPKAAEPATTAPAAKPTSDRMVCKLITPTGSRVGGKRVCRTASQWTERRLDDRANTDKGQRERALNGSSGI